MIDIVKNKIRQFLVGKNQDFTFKSTRNKEIDLIDIKDTNLYIHIPFCKSMCPYCPYNRVKYNEKIIDKYFKALSKEIDLYYDKIGSINISSIYIGGGTPTHTLEEIKTIINKIKSVFNFSGDIAIETTVTDINKENLDKLKEIGVNLLSIGVQSFSDKYLKKLGRKYNKNDIKVAFDLLKQYDFDTVNVDLIFAYSNQRIYELENDLIMVDKLGIDQVTIYPLFTFPYSKVGEYLNVNKIKMPSFKMRRKFYKKIHNFFINNDYKMVSVWGFKKNDKNNMINNKNYSSVTRENYIGIGAGAGTRLKNIFYFNTFLINSYEDSILEKNELPISIDMSITESLSNYYWFYWRLYETSFSINEFNEKSDFKMKSMIIIFKILGFYKKSNNIISLTERGAFWIHLIQNHFVLNYINKVWNTMKKNPFPEKIEI